MPVTYVRGNDGQFISVGPGSVTTDTTLSLAGKPADAAAVGNAIAMKADRGHSHVLSDVQFETLPVAQGGTGCDIRNAAVTLTHINVASNSSSSCTYFPYLKMCFLRAYIKLDNDISVGNVLDIIEIDGAYRPSSVTALAVWCGNAMVAANIHKGSTDTDRAIVSIRSEEMLPSGTSMYVSGWFAASYV